MKEFSYAAHNLNSVLNTPKICYNEYMRWVILSVLALTIFSQPVAAQNENLDIVAEPICFALVNEADYKVFGNISTDYFVRPDGIKARHRSNFRLGAMGDIDEETGQPLNREEFCSYGPFLPDRQLELTLRTLFPVFSCKTRIDQGEIIIKGERKADDSGVDTWAECYNGDGTVTGKPPPKQSKHGDRYDF